MSFRVWEYERRDKTLRGARLVAIGGLRPHGFSVELLSTKGEHVTVQIMHGALVDSASILFVESHGTFEILAVEPWPESGRFLTLRPWPARD